MRSTRRMYEVRVIYTVELDEEVESPQLVKLYDECTEEQWDNLLEDVVEVCLTRHVSIERLM